MVQPVGVAVFGCGGVSAGHFAAHTANPMARLVAAVDVRLELAQVAAERWGADGWYSSADEALADADVQLADLCLLHALHATIGIQANAGKRVFVEKPIDQQRAIRLPLVSVEAPV